MNERFKELADQARKYARDYVADCKHYGHYMEHNELDVRFEEKFAELIVRECITQINEAIPDTDCSASGAYKTAKIAAITRVKDHFGVEE